MESKYKKFNYNVFSKKNLSQWFQNSKKKIKYFKLIAKYRDKNLGDVL